MIVHLAHRFLKTFFARHLFERLVCYVFFTELVIKVVFELLQGQSFYFQSQNKQYLFYGFIIFDYLITVPRWMHLKVQFNYITLFLLLLIVMVMQGVFVGIVNHNHVFEIFNDTVPLLVLILNALRLQSFGEGTPPVDFHRLLKSCTWMGVSICLAGQLGLILGLPSQANVGAMTSGIYFPLFFAILYMGEKLSFHSLVAFGLIFGISAINMNRTTLAFIVLAVGYYVMLTLFRNPVKGMAMIVVVCCVGGIGWNLLPEDSGTYQRVMAISELNFSDTKGSVGERRSEMLSIARDLEQRGLTAQLLGRGHGGLYEVQATHQYIKNYGHAHYSWALFNLRYGMSGYIYLAMLALLLIYHTWRNWRMWTPISLTVALMCVQSFLYLGTYVNFVFLLAGLQFLYLPRAPMEKRESVTNHAP